MTDNQGGAFAFLKSNHELHTKSMQWRLSLEFDYSSDKLDALSWHANYLQQLYMEELSVLYNEHPKEADFLSKCGISPEQVMQAADQAFGLDIKFLDNKSIPNKLLLPCSHIRLSHKQAIDEFSRFTSNIRRCNFSVEHSAKLLEKGIKGVIPIFEHYDGIYPSLKGVVLAEQEELHRNLIGVMSRAIQYIESQGEKVEVQMVKKVVGGVVNKNASVERSEELARIDLSLTDIKKGVQRVWPKETFRA